MLYQAHKGVSTENPENTMHAYLAAIEQGYDIIELDVRPTKDLQFVMLHDKAINRTGRDKNGKAPEGEILLSDLSYEEVMEYDFGIWFAEKFRGTRLALFRDVLELARANGVKVKVDNKHQRFTPEQKQAFFRLLKSYEDTACLTCSTLEAMEEAVSLFPAMHMHYDGKVSEDSLKRLSALLPRERLTVWLPHQNPSTAWVKIDFASPALAELIKPYASLGVWILSDYRALEDAIALGADVIETNGQIKPPRSQGLKTDLHTHSQYSHDSVCPIEGMAKAQQAQGTSLFAVTDHFDTYAHPYYDVFTPIRESCETVQRLNEAGICKCDILKGIEISESFWYPHIYRKAMELARYDVVLGSVHLVRYKDLTSAYSSIDFSKLPKEEIVRYVDAYFDDVLTLLDTTDFDVLAHLTCPLRYINGKYNIGISLAPYAEKIRLILKTIIKKGIALEVNSSGMESLGQCMPPRDILETYFQMGGYLLTLGSDAHNVQRAAANLDHATRMLRQIGFKNVFYYKNRAAQPVCIGR